MVKTSSELEKEFIATCKERTGKTLQQWLSLVSSSSILKRNDILEWLKRGHGLQHLQAQFISGIHLNQGKPVYSNEAGLLDSHFNRYQNMRTLFDTLSQKLISEFHGTQLISKKTYISFTAIREFAAVNIKQSEIRLGLDLGDMPFTVSLQKAKLTGPMPRISHMLTVTETQQVDTKIISLVRQSYNRTHKK